MAFPGWVVILVIGSTALLLLCLEIGRRLGVLRAAAKADAEDSGVGAVQAALFGLLGLFIAFTYSGAAERWERRRQLAVQEANAIGTAYLRLDLLPPPSQPALRDLFRRYTDTRITTYRALPDFAAVRAELDRGAALQREIWTHAVAAAQASPSSATAVLVIPALNEMIDITTTRTTAAFTHVPTLIFAFVGILSVVCALLAGYGMGRRPERSWLHSVAFALTVALAIYVIVDFEFPRRGLIRLDAFDQALMDVRAQMR